MTWEAPAYFGLLLLIPVIYLFSHYLGHKVRMRRKVFFSDELFRQLYSRAWIRGRQVKEVLLASGFFFLVLALAGPKIGTEVREVQRDQLDLLVALDLSLSMKSEDVRPSRLEKALFEIHKIPGHLQNDRIGLIVFTGHAYLHCPLTTDYGAFRMFLDIADTDIMPSTTTDFRPLFREAINAFRSSAREDENPARVLVIFSDGEDHFNRYDEPLKELLDMGVVLFTVGIGTEEGGPIPIYDPSSGTFIDYHRTLQGSIVETRLNPEALEQLARLSGGRYFQISRTAHHIGSFLSQLDDLERRTFASEEITRYQNRFYYPAAAALVCIALFLVLPSYRSRKDEPSTRTQNL